MPGHGRWGLRRRPRISATRNGISACLLSRRPIRFALQVAMYGLGLPREPSGRLRWTPLAVKDEKVHVGTAPTAAR